MEILFQFYFLNGWIQRRKVKTSRYQKTLLEDIVLTAFEYATENYSYWNHIVKWLLMFYALQLIIQSNLMIVHFVDLNVFRQLSEIRQSRRDQYLSGSWWRV